MFTHNRSAITLCPKAWFAGTETAERVFMVYVRRQGVPSSGEKVPSCSGNKEGFLGEEALERVVKAGLNLNACSEWGEGFPGSQYGREKFSQTVIRKKEAIKHRPDHKGLKC